MLLSDGILVLRPPISGDEAALIAGRDDMFRRFLGEGSTSPQPSFAIERSTVAGIVGWVDYERSADQTWLGPSEVNVGYNVFAAYRGRGYATRAVRLLLRHLAARTAYEIASLTIAEDNAASLRVAELSRFVEYPSPHFSLAHLCG